MNQARLLALMINGQAIDAPADIPTGGFSNGGFLHILQVVILLFFLVAILLTLFMLMYAGYQWMSSGGESKAVGAARSRIIHAIMGLVLIFLSFGIINILAYMFHVPLLPGINPQWGQTQADCPTPGVPC